MPLKNSQFGLSIFLCALSCFLLGCKEPTATQSHLPMQASLQAHEACRDLLNREDLAEGLDPQLKSEIAQLTRGARLHSEFLSIDHQVELLQMTEALAEPMAAARFHMLGLQDGILDSDLGKLQLAWKDWILDPSAMADEILMVLQGRSYTPAGVALTLLLSDAGFQFPALISPDLSLQQVRDALEDLPLLQKFLHELPGLGRAIHLLNSGQIDERQFRARVSSNLFHNGPQAGYWGQLTTVLVPNVLKASRLPYASHFFKRTVFESEGRHLRYPNPISAEGLLHALLDRLSQETGVGLLKIFLEMTNSVVSHHPDQTLAEWTRRGENGFSVLSQILIPPKGDGLQQIEKLDSPIRVLKGVTDVQRLFLKHVQGLAYRRVIAFQNYIRRHVQESSIDPGTSFRETLDRLRILFEREKQTNGPLIQLDTETGLPASGLPSRE